MSTADLSLVTGTLRRLLATNIERLAGGAASAVTVTCGYPDAIGSATRTVNLHLYHIAEDQFRRNLPGPGTDRNNVATTPLALSLFYIMTVHHTAADMTMAWQVEQQLLGYALKTLHDYPTISDDTQMSTSTGATMPVLLEDLRNAGNMIDVVLRPLAPEDSVTYWSAEQDQPVRPSAFYEVRTVLMDPEEARSNAGLVYAVGQSVVPRIDLALGSSRSEIVFDRPASIAASLPGSIPVSPARPALDRPAADAMFPDNAAFTIAGTGLAGGLARRLMVRTPRWRALGVPNGEIAVAPGAAAAGVWGLAVQPGQLTVTIDKALAYVDAAGAAAEAPVFPGHYSAALEVVVAHQPSGDASREVVQRSNDVVFTITPRILGADAPVTIAGTPGAPAPADQDRQRITIHVAPGVPLDYRAGHPAEELDVRLTVDGIAYRRVAAFAAVPAANDGSFAVAPNALTFQPLFDSAAPGLHAVRLSVEGADAQPFWIEL